MRKTDSVNTGVDGRKSLFPSLCGRRLEAAVGRVNEGRGVVLTLVSRPFLGTVCEAGEQGSRASAQPALQGPLSC